MLRATNQITKVHAHALAAALVASGASAVPPGLGSLMEFTGLDPVRGIQNRMLRCLSDIGFPNHATNAASLPASRAEVLRYARQLSGHLAKGPLKRKLAALLGRRASYAVPVAGALLVAVMTYRETWLIGTSSLSRSLNRLTGTP